ncbi:glycine--tRNA ligase [Candidatus Gracilibacteria bacterium]|nr:MAG: glycine--tRNA ligase [Candidatus Gracilibacteria bacterium]PIE85197.1 MAG: glycine--tRNA ligase [Candidatus Gracilibacteria bacterium]
MKKEVTMKDIVNLCQNRGFVYAGSEIYGGLANSWDYGPYGSLLKENIKNLWIKEMVQRRTDMVLQDAAILMNSKVWVASGHVGGFADPLIDDKNTKERFRADKLLEDLIEEMGDKASSLNEKYGVSGLIPEAWTLEQQTAVMRGENVKNPNNGEVGDWTDAKQFNLMFRTSQGVTDDSSSTIYMRPETAQGIFVNFGNILRSSRRKLPFGVAQVGKAFRNEITPGNFIFRTREFEQMEIEYFVEPGKDLEAHAEWKNICMNFLTDTIGLKKESLKLRDHDQDELSHYSNATTDIEFKFPFGWGELWGIADRTDFDLKAHMAESRQDLSYFDPINNKKYVPYVIEPSIGLTRLFLAIMSDAYNVDEENNRTYLKFEPKIAPIKVGVLPVVKKIGDIAKKVYSQLSEDFVCEYDDVGSIGKRYARMDEIGTPFCVTIDSNNFDEGNVTVRFRDSMEQKIVKISELNQFIREKLK